MPNRIIRPGILTSKSMTTLSAEAKWTFLGLLLSVDDWGRVEEDLEVLRGQIYLRDLDRVSMQTIKRHIDDMADLGLVVRYSVSAKSYLCVPRFRQPKRSSESLFPPPTESICLACAARLLCKCSSSAKHLERSCDPTHTQSHTHIDKEGQEEKPETRPVRRSGLEREPPNAPRVDSGPPAFTAETPDKPYSQQGSKLNVALAAIGKRPYHLLSPDYRRRIDAAIDGTDEEIVAAHIMAAAAKPAGPKRTLDAALAAARTQSAGEGFASHAGRAKTRKEREEDELEQLVKEDVDG